MSYLSIRIQVPLYYKDFRKCNYCISIKCIISVRYEKKNLTHYGKGLNNILKTITTNTVRPWIILNAIWFIKCIQVDQFFNSCVHRHLYTYIAWMLSLCYFNFFFSKTILDKKLFTKTYMKNIIYLGVASRNSNATKY